MSGWKLNKKSFLLCLIFLLSMGTGEVLYADEVDVPVEVHFPLLIKVLSFERNLPFHQADTIRIGVLYQSRFRQSNQIISSIEVMYPQWDAGIVDGNPARIIPIDIADIGDLEARIVTNGIHILYIAPLRSIDIRDIAVITRRLDVLSITGYVPYVDSGVSIGVGLRGGQPELVANLQAIQGEGADFSARILRLARVVE